MGRGQSAMRCFTSDAGISQQFLPTGEQVSSEDNL